MRNIVLALTLFLATGAIAAERHKLTDINAETPEGKLLQQIGQENDAAKKLALMEQFATEHPKHDAVSWVLFQMQQAYNTAGQPDKAIAAGEKLIANDPDDLEAAYANLKAAEQKKDPALVQKWAETTSALAKKAAAAPKKEGDDEAEHKNAVDLAKQIDTYTEYAVYASALQSTDPNQTMEMTEALAKRNPDSPYIAQVLGAYARAMAQAKAFDRGVQFGEAVFAKNQFHEDMLLAMANYFMEKKASDKVLLYAGKITETLPNKPKPDGVSDVDWDKKKNTTLGVAHWMQGMTLAAQNKFPQADKSLRAALPLIKENEQLVGPATFYLGLANYKMANKTNKALLNEALKFSQQSAAIKGPLQASAATNVKAIRGELGIK